MIDEILTVMGRLENAETDQWDKILRDWAIQIIDEAVGSFECTIEDGDEATDIMTTDGEVVRTNYHPVLVRQSILDVKSKIV